MMRKGLAVVVIAVAFLNGCESYSPSKQDIGMATGAVLGGLLGHQWGRQRPDHCDHRRAAVGAFLGSHVGRKMDRADQLRTAEALETSHNGNARTWRNSDSGQHYTVTPTRTYEGASGRCRDFTTVMSIYRRDEVVHGTACRQPDGTWKVS